MNIHVLPAGPIQTNAYLLAEPSRGEAVLIDAPGGVWSEVQPILRAEKCRLVELWITHGHWDHTQGAAEVVRATGARVRAHADDKMLFETPEVMTRFSGEDLELEPIRIDAWVRQGEIISALGTAAEVRHVPGHCPGNVLYYFPSFAKASDFAKASSDKSEGRSARGAAFVGDAIFAGSVGRTDFPGGSFPMLEKSIREQIYTLPEKTEVFPGHGPATTVGEEKRNNPYVRG